MLDLYSSYIRIKLENMVKKTINLPKKLEELCEKRAQELKLSKSEYIKYLIFLDYTSNVLREDVLKKVKELYKMLLE